MMKCHDQKIEKLEFVMVDLVLLFNSRFRLFPQKLNSKWICPFIVTQVLPHGAIELENKEGTRFQLNGQRIKVYMGKLESMQEVIEAYYLDEILVINVSLWFMTLNKSLLVRQPKMYHLANYRFFFSI